MSEQTALFDTDVTKATFSPCRTYRYSLERSWSSDGSRCVFCMLNPSTADESVNDPTIRRCIGFAKKWGLGGLWVVNIFALRSTNPHGLVVHADPIGPENDRYLLEACGYGDLFVCAWGVHGTCLGRDKNVLRLLSLHANVKIVHLGLTKDGHPKHPLYLSGNSEPVEWTR